MIERREGPAVVPAALVVGIFVMLFSGRTPTPGLPDIELRFVLLIFLLIFFLLWKGGGKGVATAAGVSARAADFIRGQARDEDVQLLRALTAADDAS